MTEKEMAIIAHLMARALRDRRDPNSLSEVRKEVAELCSSFIPYGD